MILVGEQLAVGWADIEGCVCVRVVLQAWGLCPLPKKVRLRVGLHDLPSERQPQVSDGHKSDGNLN